MMVDDGTPGVNEAYAFQHPLAQESCNPLINDLTGKIAVFYRVLVNLEQKKLSMLKMQELWDVS